MKLFLLTLVVFGVVLFGMSVGVIFGNRRIRGILWRTVTH